MRFSRFGLVLLALLLPIAIGGCGGDSEKSTDSGTGNKPAETRKVAFVTNMIADFWKIAQAGCRDAEKDLGVKVEVRMPAQKSAAEQRRVVQDLITSGIDGLAISVVDPDNQTEWINELAGKVKLITQDSDAPASDRILYIGMDNYQAGRLCGELVKEALPEGGKVLLFVADLEQDNARFRRQGVIDELLDRDRDLQYYRDQPNAFDPAEAIKGDKYEIIATLLDQGEPTGAQRNAEDAISTYADLGAMVGLFEYNPPACYQALQKAGKLGAIKLIGFDENTITLQAIKDGFCQGTIVQDPYQYGYKSVETLVKLLDGDTSLGSETTYIDVPPRKIVADNVDAYRDDLQAKTRD
ncbi:MAG TPA: sugar ABC transporter substrate-binding protein [Planctomycetaceae bacterium]|nr:sugar ABC transporter substrate-binding protein [Planctomycetaceae bacterium]HRF01652.1 sugar-binding protein [Pirellulaceae bacterium]